MLDDSIVSLVTETAVVCEKGAQEATRGWRLRRRRSSRSVRVELQQELAHRGERRVLKFKEQRLRERFGEGDRT